MFFTLASEGNTPNPMGENFIKFHDALVAHTPKGMRWEWARYPDEDHGSTVLRAHYAGLKFVFDGWQIPRDAQFNLVGGLAGVEAHYKELSKRFGYPIPVPEATMNNIGYQLLGQKKFDDAIIAFKRNVEVYPDSANVYDSLGEGLEGAGKFEEANANFQKALELATRSGDGNLSVFKQHVERVAAEMKTASASAEAK